MKQDSWLAPLFSTKNMKGILPIEYEQYMTLLEWTGQQIREDKRGAIPKNIIPIMERLKLKADTWIDNILCLGKKFHRVIASEEIMQECAANLNKKWLHGIQTARKMYN